jgi:hypothetical protein
MASVNQRTQLAGRNRLEMSGVFNQSMVDRVGANEFTARFDPDILAQAIMSAIQELP